MSLITDPSVEGEISMALQELEKQMTNSNSSSDVKLFHVGIAYQRLKHAEQALYERFTMNKKDEK